MVKDRILGWCEKQREMGKVVVGVSIVTAVATCAVAAIVVGKRVRNRRKWGKVVRVLKELEEGCGTPVSRLKQVVDAMAVEMHAGLASEDVFLKVRKLVVNICDVVTRRAARIVAVGIVGILKKIGRDRSGGLAGTRAKGSTGQSRRTVVAIEGGLYANYRLFREYLDEGVAEILGDKLAPYVILQVTEDCSGIRAALLAASYGSRTIVT